VDLGDDIKGYIMFLADAKKDKESFLLRGRAMASQFDFIVAKRWIDICTSSHGDECSLHFDPEMQHPLKVSIFLRKELKMLPLYALTQILDNFCEHRT
jgi:hypothetical protein